MQRLHFQVRVGVFNCQQILAKISFVIFDKVIKKTKTIKQKKQIECGLAWHWWNSTDLGLIDMFLINLNAEIVACILPFRKSRHKPNLQSTSKYGFPPIWGENGGVLSMRMQVILDSSLARLGSALIWGGKKGEFRDWTKSWWAPTREKQLFTAAILLYRFLSCWCLETFFTKYQSCNLLPLYTLL